MPKIIPNPMIHKTLTGNKSKSKFYKYVTGRLTPSV